MNLQKFPRYPLTFGPRPSHRYRACRPTWAARHLYAKREDCNSGLAFGGNKTRKMEYLIPGSDLQATTRWCRLAASSPTRRARWPPWRRTWA